MLNDSGAVARTVALLNHCQRAAMSLLYVAVVIATHLGDQNGRAVAILLIDVGTVSDIGLSHINNIV